MIEKPQTPSQFCDFYSRFGKERKGKNKEEEKVRKPRAESMPIKRLSRISRAWLEAFARIHEIVRLRGEWVRNLFFFSFAKRMWRHEAVSTHPAEMQGEFPPQSFLHVFPACLKIDDRSVIGIHVRMAQPWRRKPWSAQRRSLSIFHAKPFPMEWTNGRTSVSDLVSDINQMKTPRNHERWFKLWRWIQHTSVRMSPNAHLFWAVTDREEQH